MATVLGNNQVKLNNGQIVQAQENAWYDGQNFSGGQLGAPGVKISSGVGQGQTVSADVISQTNPANVAYVNQQRQQSGLAPVPAQAPVTSQTVSSAASSASPDGMGAGIMAPETINLPKLYESLYQGSGIRDVEAGLTDKTNQFNAQVAKIKDNPYLSEANMTGRISKLSDKFNADKTLAQNDIAMKKADIETQLNLQTKQFDINSQQAQQAFQQFQSLLSSGALDNASGTDIANITRATGLSSSMIQSAIGVNKAKNAPKVNTSVLQTDDGTNRYAVVINSDTGEVINKQNIGASTPTAAEVKAGLGGGGTVSDAKQRAADKAAAPGLAIKDAMNRMTLGTLMNLYKPYGMTAQQIYDIYIANAPKDYNANSSASIEHDTALYHVKHN